MILAGFEGYTFNKKHDINQLYKHIKERHGSQQRKPLRGIQHEKLLPKLRPYQQEAITWMVEKERQSDTGEKGTL